MPVFGDPATAAIRLTWLYDISCIRFSDIIPKGRYLEVSASSRQTKRAPHPGQQRDHEAKAAMRSLKTAVSWGRDF